jgi:hypothetical protein
MSPILGIWASQNYTRYSITGSYDSIATVSVGSGGASNVEFTSIPGTYTHLQIRFLARDNRSGGAVTDNLRGQFNSDTGSNYTRHELWGDGSGAFANGTASQTSAQCGGLSLATSSSSANVFGVGVIDILDYSNTNKYKTVRCLGGTDNNGGGAAALSSGLWQSTSAITSIKLFGENGGTLNQYSHFALYGIKGA